MPRREAGALRLVELVGRWRRSPSETAGVLQRARAKSARRSPKHHEIMSERPKRRWQNS